MARMPGDFPAFALIEAAKGSFNYVNLWPMRPTEFYDLSAGIMLIRGAGGEVVDLDGLPTKQKGQYETCLKKNSRNPDRSFHNVSSLIPVSQYRINQLGCLLLR